MLTRAGDAAPARPDELDRLLGVGGPLRLDRHGRLLLLTLKGKVEAYYRAPQA